MRDYKKEIKGLAVVTGASSGIGYELAKVFAEEGFPLIVASEDLGIFAAAENFRDYGIQVEPVRVDLATFSGVELLYQKIREMDVPLECVAINAGVGAAGAFLDTNLEKELNLIQLNIASVVHLTKLILPDLVARDNGYILLTSSIAAEMPGPYEAVYAASKAFVQSFAEALSIELKDTHVSVTALQPGATDTNFFARAGMLDTRVGQGRKDDPAGIAREGFDAMMSRKDHHVAGSFMNKIQVTFAKLISQHQSGVLHEKYSKPQH